MRTADGIRLAFTRLSTIPSTVVGTSGEDAPLDGPTLSPLVFINGWTSAGLVVIFFFFDIVSVTWRSPSYIHPSPPPVVKEDWYDLPHLLAACGPREVLIFDNRCAGRSWFLARLISTLTLAYRPCDRGVGGSSTPKEAFTLSSMASDVTALMDEVGHVNTTIASITPLRLTSRLGLGTRATTGWLGVRGRLWVFDGWHDCHDPRHRVARPGPPSGGWVHPRRQADGLGLWVWCGGVETTVLTNPLIFSGVYNSITWSRRSYFVINSHPLPPPKKKTIFCHAFRRPRCRHGRLRGCVRLCTRPCARRPGKRRENVSGQL